MAIKTNTVNNRPLPKRLPMGNGEYWQPGVQIVPLTFLTKTGRILKKRPKRAQKRTQKPVITQAQRFKVAHGFNVKGYSIKSLIAGL
jgi:hypothetical protein